MLEMVVHSPPTKKEVPPQRENDHEIPPAVLAAAAAERAGALGNLQPAAAAAALPPAEEDLLGLNDAQVLAQVEVHAEREDGDVRADRERVRGNLTDANVRDDDRISAAGSEAGDNPQLNPFTPEWFAQIIGAAATAAATAVATSSRSPSSSSTPTAPRRLNERKVPDFWEDRPEFWFRIFDSHLSHFSPSEQHCFDTLLPLLTPAARAVVHSVIRTPGATPYSKARESLLRHFGRTPRQLAREFMVSHSVGDKLATEFLDHIMGLAPDIMKLYEVVLLDALPANARVAALQHSNVHAMARPADEVILENRAEAASSRACLLYTSDAADE